MPPYYTDEEALLHNGEFFDFYLKDGKFVRSLKIHNGAGFVQIPRGIAPAVYLDTVPECYRALPVPCGMCESCRLKLRRGVAYRLLHEAELYPEGDVLFLTLTYEDCHLTWKKDFNHSSFEEYGDLHLVDAPSLVKSDVVDFKKRLRSRLSYSLPGLEIRTFECGEYGSLTLRPHYHMIVYGLSLDFLRPYGLPQWQHRGQWRSAFLEDVWGKGMVTVCLPDLGGFQYVAGYVLKKAYGKQFNSENELFYLAGDQDPELELFRNKYRIKRSDEMIEAPFTSGSRRPGIARRWYEEHKDELWSLDSMYIKCRDKVLTVQPLSYYDRLYDVEDHAAMTSIKLSRREKARARQDCEVILKATTHQALYEKQLSADSARFARIKRDGV